MRCDLQILNSFLLMRIATYKYQFNGMIEQIQHESNTISVLEYISLVFHTFPFVFTVCKVGRCCVSLTAKIISLVFKRKSMRRKFTVLFTYAEAGPCRF
jgi:hypothetical protein